MFKQNLIFTAFALVILLVACNDSDETVEIVETYLVELSISFPEKDADFQYQGWNGNKEIAAIRTDTRYSNKLVLSPSGGETYNATSEKEITEYTDFAFLYPASASTVATSDTTTQVLYIDRQEGTLDGLADFDYIWGTYTYDMDDENYTSTSVLTSLMSFCKFGFTENGRPLEHISQVIITSPTDSLHVVGNLNLKDGSVTSQNTGSMMIRNNQGLSGEVYAAFFPMETSLHFTVSTLDGKSYEAVLPEMVRFEAGNTMIYSDIACSVMEAAQIGDYYYDDATWSASLDESKTCVGIVYALDGADGNLSKNLSESSHGRVVALHDCAEQVAWCVTAEDIEGIENQTVLQDTMCVGSLPYWDGRGDGFFSEDIPERLGGMEINPLTGQIVNWYSQGVLSDFEGEDHSLQVRSMATYYAIASCESYGSSLYGWYLPSEGELALLWSLHRSGIIDNETYPVFDDFKEFGYWTSAEYDEGSAWYINFFSGMTTKNSKNSTYHVRPVIRF